MTITDKTRKMLWARSGNRCALCRALLILAEEQPHDTASVVGEECHIHAQNRGGPRFNDLLDETKIDDYDNLLLLCRIHHKQIDDQWASFPTSRVREIKRIHEQWVRDTLEPKKAPEPPVTLTTHLTTGKDISDLLASAHHGYDFSHDPIETEVELELVGGFLQNLKDWGDIWDDLELMDQIKTAFGWNAEIKRLEEAGFLVFGGRRNAIFKAVDGKRYAMPTSVIRILRRTNPQITVIPKGQ